MNIYVVIEGEQRGPLSSDEVRELLESGKLKPDDPALLEGEKQWSTVARMARLPDKGHGGCRAARRGSAADGEHVARFQNHQTQQRRHGR